jgi:serine/threonine protein kinase
MRTLTFNRILGTGAMGTVYHAELRVPQGFARQCAVKVLKSSSQDQTHFRTRMRDEARLLGMLQDEQILGVADLVQIKGRDCVIMEYVEGVDLSEIIANNPVPPRVLAELGAELAGALHRAHNANHPNTGESLRVIHRDVKPANVMVTSRGGVRLLDFGVARAAFASRESQTQGLVLGTLNYFPPEILAGGEPTPAVDLYGLGLTLWECASGKDWGSPQVHRSRFERRVTQRLAEIEDDYPYLNAVMKKILVWDPRMRPSGGLVERELLAAADASSGVGLRTWGRKVVPSLLKNRSRSASDEWVGKTLQIDGGDEEIQSTGPQSLSPLKLSAGGIEGDGDPTFNDLAPPAAVQRARKNHQANADTIQPKEPLPPVANSGGSRRLQVMVAIASLVLGAGLGMLFIGLVFLIVVIGQTL